MLNTLVEVLAPKGTLDNPKGKLLLQNAEALVQVPNTAVILLDLKEIKFIDSAGLGGLVKMLKMTESAGKRLCLCSLNSQVAMLIQLTRMDRMFEIFKDQAEFCKVFNKDLPTDQQITPEKCNLTRIEL